MKKKDPNLFDILKDECNSLFMWGIVGVIMLAGLYLFGWITKPFWIWLYHNGIGGIWNIIVSLLKTIWCGVSRC